MSYLYVTPASAASEQNIKQQIVPIPGNVVIGDSEYPINTDRLFEMGVPMRCSFGSVLGEDSWIVDHSFDGTNDTLCSLAMVNVDSELATATNFAHTSIPGDGLHLKSRYQLDGYTSDAASVVIDYLSGDTNHQNAHINESSVLMLTYDPNAVIASFEVNSINVTVVEEVVSYNSEFLKVTKSRGAMNDDDDCITEYRLIHFVVELDYSNAVITDPEVTTRWFNQLHNLLNDSYYVHQTTKESELFVGNYVSFQEYMLSDTELFNDKQRADALSVTDIPGLKLGLNPGYFQHRVIEQVRTDTLPLHRALNRLPIHKLVWSFNDPVEYIKYVGDVGFCYGIVDGKILAFDHQTSKLYVVECDYPFDDRKIRLHGYKVAHNGYISQDAALDPTVFNSVIDALGWKYSTVNSAPTVPPEVYLGDVLFITEGMFKPHLHTEINDVKVHVIRGNVILEYIEGNCLVLDFIDGCKIEM